MTIFVSFVCGIIGSIIATYIIRYLDKRIQK